MRLTPAAGAQVRHLSSPGTAGALLFPNLTVRENILFRLPRERDWKPAGGRSSSSYSASLIPRRRCQHPPKRRIGADGGDPARLDAQREDPGILDQNLMASRPAKPSGSSTDPRCRRSAINGLFYLLHKPPEIRMLSSHVSVMRDGTVVLERRNRAV